jgi:ABC-2 type transport system ATP-binding protein
LYEDLTVQENLDLYADLHGVSEAERGERYPRLLEMTALGPFTGRLAGRLSGGMKQKLGLACTLIRAPELLLLDEPTVGVDPVSRRELWEIILRLVREESLTVLLSTAYLDEAELCGYVLVLHNGKVLAQGTPGTVSALAQDRVFLAPPAGGQKARNLQAQLLEHTGVIDALPEAGQVRFVLADGAASGEKEIGSQGDEALASAVPVAPRFEDGFMILLRQRTADSKTDKETTPEKETALDKETSKRSESSHVPISPSASLPISLSPTQPVVEVRDLLRRFGSFTAVDHVSFDVSRGEIFGLLGPNGAGKTTTFRMLCGLLPASGGTLRVAGMDLRRARASARQRVGYVAQKFSLYGQLSVNENLDFFASAYGLRNRRKRERIAWALQQFELSAFAGLPTERLPDGYRRRLAMAAALLHEPEILFLDEPTSGIDPLARREFWRRITALSEAGITVIVTTHFMEEAEYCDRVVIMAEGRVLAQGAPAEIRAHARSPAGHAPTMEDAFIAIVENARESASAPGAARGKPRA